MKVLPVLDKTEKMFNKKIYFRLFECQVLCQSKKKELEIIKKAEKGSVSVIIGNPSD